MADRMQFRRDTAANWATYNPILLEGELGFVLNTQHYKLGDGIHAWNDLELRGFNGNIESDIFNDENSVPSGAAVYSALKDSSKGFVDNEPTDNSDKLVKSGGIYRKIVENIFDVSKEFPTGGTGGTDVYDFYSARNAVPSTHRKQGMIMKFKDSAGKYEFWLLTYSTFTSQGQWLFIGDTPISTENNLIITTAKWINRRILNVINKIQTRVVGFENIVGCCGNIDKTNNVITNEVSNLSSMSRTFAIYQVSAGDIIKIRGNNTNGTTIALLSDFDFNYDNSAGNYTPSFASGETGFRTIAGGATLETITIASGVKYLLIAVAVDSNNNTPVIFTINGRDMLKDASVDYLIKRQQTLTAEEKAQVLANIGAIEAINAVVSEAGSRLDGSYKITITGNLTAGQNYMSANILERLLVGQKIKMRFTCDDGVLVQYGAYMILQSGGSILINADDFSSWQANTDYIAYSKVDTNNNAWNLYIPGNRIAQNGTFTFEIWPDYYRSLEYLASETTFNGNDKLTTNRILYQTIIKRTSGFNVSLEYPTDGESGGNTYTLYNAIRKVPSSQHVQGMTICFIDKDTNEWVSYMKYKAGTWGDENNWKKLNTSIIVDSEPIKDSENAIESGFIYDMRERLDGSYKISCTGTATQGSITNVRAFTEKFKKGTLAKIKMTCAAGTFSNYRILSQNGIEIFKKVAGNVGFLENTEYIVKFSADDSLYSNWGPYTTAAEATGSGDFTFEVWPYYENSAEGREQKNELSDTFGLMSQYGIWNNLRKRTSGFNVSLEFPTGGVNGGDTYTLSGAIAKIPSSPNQRIEGMTITFKDSETGKWAQWRKVIPGSFTNTDNWKNTEQAEVNAYQHPFSGKKLVTLCDSLGSTSQWQTLLAVLTGADYNAQKNNNWYSVGGTMTLNGSADCGQERAKRIVNDGTIIPDYIIIENVNDYAGTAGNTSDVAFFQNVRKQLEITAQASKADAESYWTNNFATIVGGETPAIGTALGIPYTTDNAIKLTITHVPTANGNIYLNLSGTQGVPSIAVTTSDTIQTILDKIIEYHWNGYDVKQVGNDSVLFSPETTGTKTLTVDYRSTGVTGTVLTGQTGANYVWRYFYSRDITEWTTAAKWVETISLYAAWKGLVEYLFANFPKAIIYWLMPKSWNFDYEDSQWHRADGTIDYDKVVAQKNYAASTFEKQITFCNLYQIPYLDIRNECCITPANISTFNNPSNVHPKQDGYDRWAQIIAMRTA